MPGPSWFPSMERPERGGPFRLALSVPIQRLELPETDVTVPATDPEMSPERQALRARFLEARKRFGRRDFVAARVLYRALLEDYPAFSDYFYRDLARMILLEAGDGPADDARLEAVADYAQRLLSHPGTTQKGWAHYFEGRVHLARGRMEEAETSFSLALAASPAPPRSVLYYYLGRSVESRQPLDAYVYYRRAAQYGDGRLAARADRAAERLGAELRPEQRCVDWSFQHDRLARQLTSRRNVPLYEAIEEAIDTCPCPRNRLDFERLRGLYFLRTHRLERAAPYLEKVLAEEIAMGDPRWSTVREWARALAEADEPEAREALLERYVAAGPGEDGVDAYFLLAYLRRKAGRRADADALYREVVRRFPDHPRASEARWLSTWGFIRSRDWPRALLSLRSILQEVPVGSLDEAQARYWLGRVLEATGNPIRGSAVLDDVAYRFPFSYYGILAGWRLGGTRPRVRIPETAESQESVEMPRGDPPFPASSPARLGLSLLFPGFEDHLAGIQSPGPALHLERAKELWLMGDESGARRELYAAAHHPAAGSTARWMAAALRHAMGSLYYGMQYGLHYLRTLTAGDAIVPSRVALAYPFPFREAIVRHALGRGVEPTLVAAIIRQESVFDPTAGSRAGARGLMQIMPRTGRIICRWLNIRGYRAYYLKRPDFNLRLGTEYLRAMLEAHGDSLARALAAYNAGPSVVATWLATMGDLEDDAFVEEIPYRETRNYVRAVIRNFAGYLAAYGPSLPPEPPVESASSAGEAAPRAADL